MTMTKNKAVNVLSSTQKFTHMQSLLWFHS